MLRSYAAVADASWRIPVYSGSSWCMLTCVACCTHVIPGPYSYVVGSWTHVHFCVVQGTTIPSPCWYILGMVWCITTVAGWCCSRCCYHSLFLPWCCMYPAATITVGIQMLGVALLLPLLLLIWNVVHIANVPCYTIGYSVPHYLVMLLYALHYKR